MVTVLNKNSDGFGDMPEIRGGSREVGKVHEMLERLHMVVRFANLAFYSGDLEAAHETLKTALGVFHKLKNEKAMGVAHNNLGGTMLTTYRAMKETKIPRVFGMTRQEVVLKGIDHYDRAIDLGEKALARINEVEGWSNNYLIFMQQLSNRYFNRAMLLLTVRSDHPFPNEAESKGLQDLMTAKDMDCEVVNNGDRYGFKGDDDVYFELLLSRLRGTLNIVDMGYDDDWGINELLDDGRELLNKTLENPDGTTMFREIEPAGQMQRLDGCYIRYYTHVGRLEDSAIVAVRMLKQDEYVIGKKALLAIKALIDYLPHMSVEDTGVDPSDVSSSLFQFRRIISDGLSSQNELVGEERNNMMKSATSNSATARKTMRVLLNECMKQSHTGDISMETF